MTCWRQRTDRTLRCTAARAYNRCAGPRRHRRDADSGRGHRDSHPAYPRCLLNDHPVTASTNAETMFASRSAPPAGARLLRHRRTIERPTEAVNALIKKIKRVGHEFRNFDKLPATPPAPLARRLADSSTSTKQRPITTLGRVEPVFSPGTDRGRLHRDERRQAEWRRHLGWTYGAMSAPGPYPSGWAWLRDSYRLRLAPSRRRATRLIQCPRRPSKEEAMSDITISTSALARLSDYLPGPDDPPSRGNRRPGHPQHGLGDAESTAIAPIEASLRRQLGAPEWGPHPEPWAWAAATRSVISAHLDRLAIASIIIVSGDLEQAVRATAESISTLIDEWCGTPPHKGPFPRPWGPGVRLRDAGSGSTSSSQELSSARPPTRSRAVRCRMRSNRGRPTAAHRRLPTPRLTRQHANDHRKDHHEFHPVP